MPALMFPRGTEWVFPDLYSGNHVLNSEGTEAVTLPTPGDYKELEETIPWEDGSVRTIDSTGLIPPSECRLRGTGLRLISKDSS